MKKNLFIIGVIATTLISCSKNNEYKESKKISSHSIVGKWVIQKTEYYTDNEVEETEIAKNNYSICPDYAEFKNNGTYLYIKTNSKCNSKIEETAKYTFNGSKLILNYDSEEIVTMRVKSISGTSLIIEQIIDKEDNEKSVIYAKKID